MTQYANGPLPRQFEGLAYFTQDRKEWALPKEAALEYLAWCDQHGLQVLGFEVWYPTSFGPTVIAGDVGNDVGVRPNAEAIRNHPARDVHGPLVFNISAREPVA